MILKLLLLILIYIILGKGKNDLKFDQKQYKVHYFNKLKKSIWLVLFLKFHVLLVLMFVETITENCLQI